ncbi:glycosyltransferase family 4 protein [Microlunatus soli]|uniref:glycosyltransferase family 4 protein n=1 Tax=Microlunatus soli TaxID=630515 RepID=UPI0012FC4D42|nr:glycosyltransferase family 4 protein [Microlunatus soli]
MLIISNDFPPTVGGIEGFVGELCGLLDEDVVVLTRHTPGWHRHDSKINFPVHRFGRLLLPTPAVGRRAADLIRRHRVDAVIFGAMAPLALLAPTVRAAGARRLLAISHGHESWWATVPGSARLLRRMADDVDHVSYISDYTAARIAPALSPAARATMIRISPPIDLARFTPEQPSAGVDHRLLRCVAVGRMVRQKGFDTLLRAWRRVLDDGPTDPDRELVLVGDGPQAPALRRLADRLRLGASVRFTGAVDRAEVARLLRTATVFALPVRTRWAGLHPEGLGLGFLEAAASGLPVIVGRSGGAPETVIEGETGFVVDPEDVRGLASRIDRMLTDRTLAATMGAAGRRFVADRYAGSVVADAVTAALGR